MEVLAISLGRNILRAGSRDALRMKAYAQKLDAYHIVVLTRKEHGFQNVVHDGSLHLYPTNSRTRLGMLIDAFRMGMRITQCAPRGQVVVTAQDPLEIGLLSWVLSKTARARFHVQVHGDYFSSEAWVGRSPFRRMRRFFARLLLRRAPAIRVVSERIKHSLIAQGVAAEKITVLPIRPELESFLSVAHTYRNASECTFLFIGRLAPEKNIPRIIDAFAVVHKKYPQCALRIVGEGSEQARILSYIKKNNLDACITHHPWTENVPNEMNGADVFLLASKHEAYGLTLLEAMAVGLPLITTDVGCVGEVVHNQVHGIVVYDDTSESYADAMCRLVEHASEREQYGRAGRARAAQLAEVTQEKYIEQWVKGLL